jgi:hypothetical protein
MITASRPIFDKLEMDGYFCILLSERSTEITRLYYAVKAGKRSVPAAFSIKDQSMSRLVIDKPANDCSIFTVSHPVNSAQQDMSWGSR